MCKYYAIMGCLGARYAKPVELCCVVTTINSCSYMPLSSTKDCLPRTQGHAFVTRVHSKGTMLHVDLTSTSNQGRKPKRYCTSRIYAQLDLAQRSLPFLHKTYLDRDSNNYWHTAEPQIDTVDHGEWV